MFKTKKILIFISLFFFVLIIPAFLLTINYFKENSKINLQSILSKTNLITHNGTPINEIIFLNKPTFLFFGFTHCPEVCPTTLSNLTNNINQSKLNNLKYNIIFVTLDPERDDIKNLGNYIESFNDSIIGITGDIKEIDRFAKNWNVYWEKVNIDNQDYTINHTATVFIHDSQGNYSGTIAWGENDTSIQIKLKKLFNL